MGKEEFKKQKELEEARKAGTAPAELDEDGNEINPHIPQFMSQAPWYLGDVKPGLKHQKSSLKVINFDTEWYQRGKKTGKAVTKYRKGSCKNCGAMTHTAKDCVERPRSKGAKWTGEGFQKDEVIQKLTLNYDGKRDRWNGYDPSMHKETVARYELIAEKREEFRKKNLENEYAQNKHKMTREKKKKEHGSALDALEDSSSEEDEGDEDKAGTNQAGNMFAKQSTGHQRGSAGAQMSVRNLRIREDTAKYLLNLDVGSAFYDPKSRAMRANPYENVGKKGDELYLGDNFSRTNGDTQQFNQLMYHSYAAYEKGQDVHQEAMPTQAELVHKDFVAKKELVLTKRQQQVLAKYGSSSEQYKAPKMELLMQSEGYTEYDRKGKVVGGHDKALPVTKYDEDVFENGHTQVWGSFCSLQEGALVWGYACCKKTTRMADCCRDCSLPANASKAWLVMQARGVKNVRTRPAAIKNIAVAAIAGSAKGASPSPKGATPKGASPKGPSPRGAPRGPEASARSLMPPPSARAAPDEDAAASAAAEEAAGQGGTSKKEKKKKAEKRRMDFGEEVQVGTHLDDKAVRREMKKLKKQAARAEADSDDRSRAYNSFKGESDGRVTAEEMEAYNKSKVVWEDPMSKMGNMEDAV